MKKNKPLDACWDLVAMENGSVDFGEVVTIETEDYGDVPPGMVGLVLPRSGLAVKHGIGVLAGVVDSGYTGNITVVLTKHLNDGKAFIFNRGDRIAQFTYVPLGAYSPGTSSDRGEKGFGSSGTN